MTTEEVRDLLFSLLTNERAGETSAILAIARAGTASLAVQFADGTQATITTTVLRAMS